MYEQLLTGNTDKGTCRISFLPALRWIQTVWGWGHHCRHSTPLRFAALIRMGGSSADDVQQAFGYSDQEVVDAAK